MSGRKLIVWFMLLTLLAGVLSACSPAAAPDSGNTQQPAAPASDDQPPAASADQVTLDFMFWGSPQEKAAIESMVASFEASHPNIKINAQHVPDAFEEKIATMLASGTEPDVSYLGEGQALQWAEEGKLLDLSNHFLVDPEASNRLTATYYNYGDGKTIGTNTAGEIGLMFYNKDVFDKAGQEYPPASADSAWTWDEFVQAAKAVTFDANGNNALSPDFDADNIETFGITFPRWWLGYVPFLYSNGAKFSDEEGTKLLLDSPEAIEVMQNLQDLIYVHHVAPTPAQSEALPAMDVMMASGKVAMAIDGHWKILDLSQAGFPWGIGVLPYYDTPVTVLLGAPTVIFASTEHPDEAFEFYVYHNSPEVVDLFKKGLWMPLQNDYYTDDAKIDSWINGLEGVYPPESRTAVVDYTVNNTPIQPPPYWLKNWFQISTEALDPAMELLWTGEADAQTAMQQAVQDAAPLMKGVYATPNQ
jgi:multiple sugar transport system substrate-binding protein